MSIIFWRYFAWSNQTLAMVVLWSVTVYLARAGKNYLVTLLPADFMTAVTSTYLFFAPEGFSLSMGVSYFIGITLSIVTFVTFLINRKKVEANIF